MILLQVLSDAANLTSNLSIYLGLYAPSKGKRKA